MAVIDVERRAALLAKCDKCGAEKVFPLNTPINHGWSFSPDTCYHCNLKAAIARPRRWALGFGWFTALWLMTTRLRLQISRGI